MGGEARRLLTAQLSQHDGRAEFHLERVISMASNQEEARRRAERELKNAKSANAPKKDIDKLQARYDAAAGEVKGGGWGALS